MTLLAFAVVFRVAGCQPCCAVSRDLPTAANLLHAVAVVDS